MTAVHPDDRQMVQEKTAQAIAAADHYEIDHRIYRRDGEVRHVHEEAQIFKDPQTGRFHKIVGIVQDITERFEAEQKVVEQAALIDQARDAIFLRDLEHKVLFWNKGAERLYGWTAQQAVGRKTTEMIYRDMEKVTQAMQETLKTGEWTGELESVTLLGAEIIVECRWTLLRDGAGNPKSILCINSDITERKRIESQFLRAQRMESIGTLAGGIAHDLNNLLSPIIMGVELLKHFGLTGPSVKIVDNIERSAKRGSNLVKQVLSFARGVEGARVTVHIGDVINELSSMIRDTFPRNIALETKTSTDPWLVSGDPTQLNQVLLNLALNARDAMPDGGQLSISASNLVIDPQYALMQRNVSAGRYVVVEVIDNGSGIPKENIDKIFDPFFTTKELGKGTGLGLATTMGIIRSHGGFLNVYSEVGRGSTFKVYLPAQAENITPEVIDLESTDWPRGNGEGILLIDDESSILTIIQQTLEAFGYRVFTAEHGAQAVAIFAANQDKMALVLTDMMMPVMDGAATILALRELNPKIKIIAASGLNSNGNSAKAAQAGVAHFLTKPYTTGTLLGTIRTVLTEK